MRERILHYIWQNRLYDSLSLNGEEVHVVQVGKYNDGSGPDFSLVKVKTPNMLWVGAVEIHVRSSDWVKHGHQEDDKYRGVLLHVVLEHDTEVTDATGRVVPTAVLHVSNEVLHRIEDLDVGQRALRCTPELSLVPPASWHMTTDRLLVQRIERRIRKLSIDTQQEGTQVFFFHALMRYMGAHLNNDAMEITARSIPYAFLKKHSSDQTALEAMLIGQAGLISETPRDEYETKLRDEYLFYQSKFGLSPVDKGLFRKLHIRPPSYPTRRLATVATLIQREPEILTAMAHQQWDVLSNILSTPPSDYWCCHTDFGQTIQCRMRGAGRETRLSLMINVIVPTAYLYALSRGVEEEAISALEYLSKLPPERNKITFLFEQNGILLHNAAESQRAIELYTEYCSRHRCLACPIAPEIFKSLYNHD